MLPPALQSEREDRAGSKSARSAKAALTRLPHPLPGSRTSLVRQAESQGCRRLNPRKTKKKTKKIQNQPSSSSSHSLNKPFSFFFPPPSCRDRSPGRGTHKKVEFPSLPDLHAKRGARRELQNAPAPAPSEQPVSLRLRSYGVAAGVKRETALAETGQGVAHNKHPKLWKMQGYAGLCSRPASAWGNDVSSREAWDESAPL